MFLVGEYTYHDVVENHFAVDYAFMLLQKKRQGSKVPMHFLQGFTNYLRAGDAVAILELGLYHNEGETWLISRLCKSILNFGIEQGRAWLCKCL